MLGKLMKYEFKATARIFIPGFIGVIILAILSRVFFFSGFMVDSSTAGFTVDSPAGMISTFVFVFYILSLVAIGCGAFIIALWRFYSNLLRDEGYLAHTLPVSIDSHIWSKLIVGTVWCIAAFAVILGSLVLCLSTLGEIRTLYSEVLKIIPQFNAWDVLQLILMMVVSIINTFLNVYAAMAIGQLFGKHKIMGSILAYIGLSFVFTILTSLSILIFGDTLITTLENGSYGFILNGSTILMVLQSVVYYVITRYFMGKKLNLE